MIALLLDCSRIAADSSVEKTARRDALARGFEVHVVIRPPTEQDIDAASASLVRLRAGAPLVGSDAFFLARREQIVALAARHALPASYDLRQAFVTHEQPLMSYEPAASPSVAAREHLSPVRFSAARSRPTCRLCNRPKVRAAGQP